MNSINKTFNSNFGHLKHRDFVFYGTGLETKILLESLSDFSIVGILSNNILDIGRRIYNTIVLKFDEVIEKNPVIVILAPPKTSQIIFQDILFLQKEYGVDIYFKDGNLAQAYNDTVISKSLYFDNYHKLIKLINNHEIISFDIFDTLVTRQCMIPSDVFMILENCIQNKFNISYSFSTVRTEAEIECQYQNAHLYTICDIYNRIGNKLKIPKKRLNYIKSLEIALETKILIPRSNIIKAYKYAVEQGKEVYFLSDMYLSSKVVKNILNNSGIFNFDNLYISCEHNMSKSNGMIFNIFDKNKKSSVLHIGDNFTSDITNAEKHDINTFHILSPRNIFYSSSINKIVNYGTSITDKISIGLISSKIFNSPFKKLSGINNIPTFNNLVNFGYVFYGPLLFYYLVWLINESCNKKIDKILFCAREGYFILKLFNLIKSIIEFNELPVGIYFKTSRRMASVPALFNEQDIYNTFKVHRYYGFLGDLLLNRFGVLIDDKDRNKKKLINTSQNFEVVKDYLQKYNKTILANAANERDLYKSYLNSICKQNILITDQGFNGTVQASIEKIMGENYFGGYMCANTENNPYGFENINGFYSHGDGNFFKMNYLFESVFTAPEGTYIKSDSNGRFVNDKLKTNQNIFSKKIQIYKGVRLFIKDMLNINPQIINLNISNKLPDYVFGLLESSSINISDRIKQTFYLDNQFVRGNDKLIKF